MLLPKFYCMYVVFCKHYICGRVDTLGVVCVGGAPTLVEEGRKESMSKCLQRSPTVKVERRREGLRDFNWGFPLF